MDAAACGARRPSSGLFPDASERLCVDDALTLALARSEAAIDSGPVPPSLDPDAFRRELEAFDFEAARSLQDVLAWTVASLERGVTHASHPSYFGLFNPAPSFPAQCADRVAAFFNPQLASATTSPAPVAVEAHVIRAVARRAGLPEGCAGHFTSGGAEANCTALVCALTRSDPAFADGGARALRGRPLFYVSADAHLAWLKIAHATGLGRDAMRTIPTDGGGRMDLRALAGAVEADVAAGASPVMVAATAGTTAAGMIDPLSGCAEIAARFGLWFHVDAAWGGGMIASDRGRELLAGIERSCSVTIDAHKWFAVTMGCGMFITRHASVLSDAFHVTASYMPSDAPSLDPYLTSMQWSRRFLGLRLFLSLACVGWKGHAAHVESGIALAGLLRRELDARGWRIANDSPLGVLCFEPPRGRGDARAVVRSVLASGRAWISAARFEGRDVVRACVTNGRTGEAEIFELVQILTAALEDRAPADRIDDVPDLRPHPRR